MLCMNDSATLLKVVCILCVVLIIRGMTESAEKHMLATILIG